MNKLLLLLTVIFGLTCQGQQMQTTVFVDTLYSADGYFMYAIPDSSMFEICKERGHVKSESCVSTLMYCEPYVIDTDSTSTIVYPPCNRITYTCLRCGALISEQEKERRVVIWKKPKRVILEKDEIHPVMNYDSISVGFDPVDLSIDTNP